MIQIPVIDTVNSFRDHVENGPQWVYYWCLFLAGTLLLSVPFAFVRKEARAVLLGTILVIPVVLGLYFYLGYEKILGLGHLIIWGPLLVYLWRRRESWNVSGSLSGKWIVLAAGVLFISLCFDTVDVVRYAMGHRY